MKLMFNRVKDIEIRNARQLLDILNLGYAVRRSTANLSSFYFIGYNGQVYHTDTTGSGEFKLAEHYCIPLMENFHEFEVYIISWLAFDKVPIKNNQLLAFDKVKNCVSVYDFAKKQNYIYKNKLSVDFITNILREGFKDIWIMLGDCDLATIDSIDSFDKIEVMDTTLDTVVCKYHEVFDLEESLIAFRPVAKNT